MSPALQTSSSRGPKFAKFVYLAATQDPNENHRQGQMWFFFSDRAENVISVTNDMEQSTVFYHIMKGLEKQSPGYAC